MGNTAVCVIHFANTRKEIVFQGNSYQIWFADIYKCAALLSKQGFEPRAPEMKASGVNQLHCIALSFVFYKMLKIDAGELYLLNIDCFATFEQRIVATLIN